MTPLVGVIDYGAGNIGSIINMLNHVNARGVVVDNELALKRADRVLLPGVGHYDHGVRNLKSRGLFDVLATWDGSSKPLLGICLGMQLLMSGSDEGEEGGLGLIPGRCHRFEPADGTMKVPHMGWNGVVPRVKGTAISDQPQGSRYYFVHSYYAVPEKESHCAGVTSYYGDFCSVIDSGNGILGYQFHPEKSHRFGMALLKSFAGV